MGKISVARALLQWYESADRSGMVSVYDLLDFVRSVTGRMVTDGTMTRKLRLLREAHKLDYRVVDETRGLYELIEVAR